MHGGIDLLYSEKIDKEIEKFTKGVFSKSVTVKFSENATVGYADLDERYYEELSAQPLVAYLGIVHISVYNTV